MANSTGTTTQPGPMIPPDDPNKKLTVANPDDPKMRHISVAGGTYTIIVTGDETGGRYCLIDMLVSPAGGPPPHRHDFEEMLTILEGEIELTSPGQVAAGDRRFDREHPRQRAALVQEHVGQVGATSLHVYASGAGGLLHGGRRPGR